MLPYQSRHTGDGAPLTGSFAAQHAALDQVVDVADCDGRLRLPWHIWFYKYEDAARRQPILGRWPKDAA